MEELLKTIRQKLRISSSALDEDIQQNIEACLRELERVGIKIDSDSYTAPLIIKAIELYCKWQVDYLGQGDKFGRNFASLRNALSLSDEYKE